MSIQYIFHIWFLFKTYRCVYKHNEIYWVCHNRVSYSIGSTVTPVILPNQVKKPVSTTNKRNYYDIYHYKDQDYAIKGIYVPPAQKPTSQPILNNQDMSSILNIVHKNRDDKQKDTRETLQSDYQSGFIKNLKNENR